MHEGTRVLSALAAAAFVLVSSSHLLVGRLLHFATLSPTDDARRAALLFLAVGAAAFLHERLVRGLLYTRLRSLVKPGLAAPIVAVAGALAPVVARLTVLPRARVPFALVVAHAVQVETFLGFGLTWLALGSGGTLWSSLALVLVWAVRLFVVPVFHGGIVPLFESVAALAAALTVAGILARPLAPHRAAVLEAA